jgi:ribosomal protein S18 acetylase RimI-like enzyme
VKVKVDGVWPGVVTLEQGSALAESRPWNADVSLAHLRMVRGGPAFLGDCAAALGSLGADGVLSPPLPRSAQQVWRQADFVPHAALRVLRRELDHLPSPHHHVTVASRADVPEALGVDAAAFDPFWRFDTLAMQEALDATPRAVLQVVRGTRGEIAGFVVTGIGTAIAYIQRLSVHPDHQGRGIGRSLVRAAAGWARASGACGLLLNTQADNEAAVGLYLSEGFIEVGSGLAVLRK